MSCRMPSPLIAVTPGELTAAAVADFVRGPLARLAGSSEVCTELGLLVREPLLEDGAMLELLRRARRLLGPAGWLGVHDRVHLALLPSDPELVDGVHLGFRSLPLEAVRRVVGGRVAIGLSTHAGDSPDRWAEADYLFHGPVRPTPSKEGLIEPTGYDGLARAVESTAVPVYGIGGLRPQDAARVLRAGARGVAALSGIFWAPDPGAAALSFLDGLGSPGERS